ncbi:MAG TPA: amidohydrolase family protein [Alphaproteobacteria bacterium]|nr:amidohydrolase family protein [Alphaproteobacteria bacterium]
MDDLILQGGIIAGSQRDLAIEQGRIRQIAPKISAPAHTTIDITGKLVLPGFVESHIHPDKAFVADRTAGVRRGGPTPQVLVAELKKAFTVEDIYERARRVMLLAIRHGCTTMRAHVEIDAYVELRGVEALQRVQTEFAGVLDLQLIAFAQEGIFHDGVTQDLLREALHMGLPVLGGCPYMDDDQRRHIDWFFDTAEAAGVPLDFHADSGDDPARLTCDYIAEQTIVRGLQGRVTLGHLCTLDLLEPEHRARVIDKLREAGIAVISLPATEMHVKGRADKHAWRGITRIEELRAAGVNVSIATNNIVNPFTPYGHPDLLRQALITAMAAHLGNLEQMAWLLDLITVNPAQAIGLERYGLAEGCRADLVVLDASDAVQAITEQSEKLWVLKAGRVVARNARTTELFTVAEAQVR